MSYKDKKVILTGATGFLGHHVERVLIEQGAIVYATGSVPFDLREETQAIRMFDDAMEWFDSNIIDYVFHLAAIVMGIGAIEKYAYRSFYGNLMMGANVIDQAIEARVDNIVYMGTVCSYPERCPVPMVEENFWEGKPEPTNAPYGVSKRALLSMLEASGVDFTYVVAANLYGPGDNFNPDTSHVIPALIQKFHYAAQRKDQDEVLVWGTGKKSRDFLYVLDAAEALLYLGEHARGLVNIGTGVEIPIFWLAETIAKLTGFEGKIVYDDSSPSGQERRCLSLRRAKEFGWPGDKKLVDLETGLRHTYNWWKNAHLRNDQ